MLGQSVASLLDLADDPSGVEILLAVDPGDLAPALPALVWQAPERYGYRGLHRYYNALAELARGDWLMLWNDDAFMQTRGWDALIRSQPCSAVLGFTSMGYQFPVWPKAWTDYLGEVARQAFVDAEIKDIGERMGRSRLLDIGVSHERGQPGLVGTDAPGDLFDPAMAAIRQEKADKLLARFHEDL